MATAAQLAQLRAARGEKFDALFLKLMIAHHQGAVSMATDLLSEGRNTLARGDGERCHRAAERRDRADAADAAGRRTDALTLPVSACCDVASAALRHGRRRSAAAPSAVTAGGQHDGQHRVAPFPLGLAVRVRGDPAALTGPRPGEDGGAGALGRLGRGGRRLARRRRPGRRRWRVEAGRAWTTRASGRRPGPGTVRRRARLPVGRRSADGSADGSAGWPAAPCVAVPWTALVAAHGARRARRPLARRGRTLRHGRHALPCRHSRSGTPRFRFRLASRRRPGRRPWCRRGRPVRRVRPRAGRRPGCRALPRVRLRPGRRPSAPVRRGGRRTGLPGCGPCPARPSGGRPEGVVQGAFDPAGQVGEAVSVSGGSARTSSTVMRSSETVTRTSTRAPSAKVSRALHQGPSGSSRGSGHPGPRGPAGSSGAAGSGARAGAAEPCAWSSHVGHSNGAPWASYR